MRFRSGTLLSGAALAALPSPVIAQTVPASEQASDDIVVTADPLRAVGSDKGGRRFAGSWGSASADQIRDSGAINVTEALRLIPGVQTPVPNGTGNGDFAQNIGIRGLGARLGSYATVLLDGVPISNAPYGQPELSLAPVSLALLDRIDVVKSGASVHYGPQNVGGVINYVTWAIPTDFGGFIDLRGNVGASGVARSFVSGQTSFGIGGTTAGGSGAALLYSGNHGSSFRSRTQQDIDDAMLKYKVQLSSNSYVEGRIHGYNATAQLPSPLDQATYLADPFANTNNFQSYEAHRIEGTLRYVNELSDRVSFETLVFDTNSHRTFALSNANNDSRATRFDLLPRYYNTLGVEPRLSARIAWLGIEQEISIGGRYVHEYATESRLRRSFKAGAGTDPYAAAPVVNRDSIGRTNAYAGYVDDRISLGRLTVTPGIRVEDVTISRRNVLTSFEASQHYTVALPSVRLGYQLGSALFAYVDAGRSFGSVGFLQLPLAAADQRIGAETADTYDLGIRYNRAGLTMDVGIYRLLFDNQIEFDSATATYMNVGRTRHQGVESSVRYDLGRALAALRGVSVYATYAYTDATVRDGQYAGNDLRLYSRHMGTTGVDYDAGRFHAGAFGYVQSRQFADEANTVAPTANGQYGRIPGWMIWNARLGVDVTKRIRIDGGVENVLDKRYFTRASLEDNSGIYAGPPRTAYLRVHSTF